jgi:hypothetical protein
MHPARPFPPLPRRFEGVNCDIDVNECARGTSSCGPGAQCINTKGGHECVCPLGSSGDGRAGCALDADAVENALGAFWNDPNGQACDAGADIAYPKQGAGWVEDPTGFLDRDPNRRGGLGARAPVTAGQCAAACLAVKECQGFTHNPVGGGCFLKRGQCPLKNGCKEAERTCESTNDMGKTIKVPCGSWTSYFLQTVKDKPEEACGSVQSFAGKGGR